MITADRDFSDWAELLDSLPYEVHSPDSFFCLLDDSSPKSVRLIVQRQLDYWSRRRGQFNLCTQLVNAGAPEFAERVRAHLATLH